jgi:hypothetical protein
LRTELPSRNNEDAALEVLDPVLELPSAQVQLGHAVVRADPECAARRNGL